VNAWAELAAMLAGMLIALLSYLPAFGEIEFGIRLAVTAFGAAAVWIPAMLLTAPETEETLERFYRRTRPGGPGWRRQREATGLAPLQNLGADVRSGITAIVLLISLMLGIGWLVLGFWAKGVISCGIAGVAGLMLRWVSSARTPAVSP
jgi:hypothetical protein